VLADLEAATSLDGEAAVDLPTTVLTEASIVNLVATTGKPGNERERNSGSKEQLLAKATIIRRRERVFWSGTLLPVKNEAERKKA